MDHSQMIESQLPGAPPLPAALERKLRAALEAKGPGYVPRTHHLEGKAPKFTNRLILETSPYLLQHAHNPVNWFPWGDEAFEEARRTKKPVLLSVGYATCHWCHVMEEESFEDLEIARALNELYVCIKVDREERPDVDAVYMSAVQQLTGSGGWPMTVWLTPDRQPFFGGTYFPARDGDRGARRGFLSVLKELRQIYDHDPGRVASAAESLAGAVREQMTREVGKPGQSLPGAELIARAVASFKQAFDPREGGLDRAPKFPSSLPIRLLLRYQRRVGDSEALHMATLTLEKMAAGGIYDQVGGGFHRYSTDAHWLVPHFEKMLYDNALLAVAYLEAHQVTGRADFARVARETLDYVLREMSAPEGGFYSATDADSEGVEGKFFVWSERELRELLGPDAERFIRYYGVTPGGNFEGESILHVPRPDEGEWAALKGAREKLYAVRAKRVPPLRDEKVLASWNGLMISAMATGGRVLAEPRYLAAAERAAAFVLERMRKDGRLMRSFKDGRAAQPAFLDDYAFLAQGLLDLYEASFELRWLKEALALSEALEAQFADREHGGWFRTGEAHEKLLAREKPGYDGAEPSGSSIAISNALRLATFTGDDRWRQVAEKALGCFAEALQQRPMALTEMLLAVDFLAEGPREVLLVWPTGQAVPEPLLAVLRKTFVPNRILAGAAEGVALEALAKVSPLAEGRRAQSGRPTAYVCQQGTCKLPTSDPAVFARQLEQARPLSPAR